jgi:flagellar motor protein MotB
MLKHGSLLLLCTLLASPAAGAQGVREVPVGEAAERHLSADEAPTQWAHDPQLLQVESGDRLEQREVLAEQPKTVKLKNVVPPIRFESGVADIPPTYIEKLRTILESMRHLENVQLHLVGHADDQPLSDRLAGIYGDNAGLSRERAGEVAELIQTALALPPDAISFEWAGATQPIATNSSPEGRALNRRVEVEVWYDEIETGVGLEEVVVSEEIKRVKVCRVETLCKLRYREGHARRARVKNLIAPLHFSDDTVGVSKGSVEQIGEALHNLRDKQNVMVKFIGFTDDAPLTGRIERIYGTHLALSKARAHRVALAIQEALDLPNAAIASDGHGATRPVASNETTQGRALNRRVEIEFWYDDPLQELPDEPQLCPDAAAAEVVTKVYDPPWGRIAPLSIGAGHASIEPDYAEELRRAMDDVADKTNVRLRFVGYTGNKRLDRRTAMVYGDDIGLSAARARRAMETVKATLGLSESQAEHEGRGYLHSNDVVNAGFIQGDTSHVVVQVVYDELAVLDDYEGIDVTPITRELRPENPLGLNLMRITVDGEPLDDPGRSSADIQRCTDVALERADIQFRFDNLRSERRLSVASKLTSVQLQSSEDDGPIAPTVRFRMYTNYSAFIGRSEVRIFESDQSTQGVPLDVVEVGQDGFAEWQPAREAGAEAVQLKYVLRAYDGKGHFDETAPQLLWMIQDERSEGLPVDGNTDERSSGDQGQPEAGGEEGKLEPGAAKQPQRDELLGGYGESGLSVRNIPLGSGTVEVQGRGIPPEHTVWLAGEPVPVDEHGNFVAQTILPSGMHTVEVAVLDQEGNGELFLRDLELERNDWFYVGMADLTLATNSTSGPADSLTGHNARDDLDSTADGRLAFYVNGRFSEGWRFTASADTREGPTEDLFRNFLDKSPESLFRRIDPDYYYPTYGDDSTVEELAPTMGKFFLKLNKRENHALWGNFDVSYLDNELAHVDRGLYGGNVHYQSLSTTSFGEQRLVLDGFAAEPGTVPSRDEFRATGGSLYFLRRQDLLTGSDRVRIEVRDKDSGLVTSVTHLRPGLDYDIDHLQGRILLSEPLAATVDDGQLVRSGGLIGNEAWLVVQYEYTPGFEEMDTLATGGQGHYWFGDLVKLGLTGNSNAEGDGDSNLYAADVTVRKSAESWLKLQAGRRDGLVSSWSRSEDGGFDFLGTEDVGLIEADAGAYRGDISIGLSDFFPGARGRLTLYAQNLDAGYSAPGLTAPLDTRQFGGAFALPLTERLHLSAKADSRLQTEGLETTAGELDMGYQLTDRWSLSAGLRSELREDNSPVVPVTQEEGERTDAALQMAYDSRGRWSGYGFAQSTLSKSESREDNGRVGVGGSYRLSDRLSFNAEASHGQLGPAARLGTSYQATDRTTLYLNYALENERTDNGLHARRDNLIAGARTRLSDSASVYLENRYQQSDSMTGLTHATGINLTPSDRWNLGSTWDMGTLVDNETGAETKRKAGSLLVGYGFEKLKFSSGIEYRLDEAEQLDGTWTERTTYLFRNSLKLQMTPDWRVVGRLNHSFSDSSLGQFYDGGYTEGVLGFAYRPVEHDRLNVLAKYTYFYNVPATDQFTLRDASAQFTQKSHIASFDVMYDLTRNLSVGGKYAYRLGQVSLDREDPNFFDNNAHLYILRADWRFSKDWEGTAEMRMLDLPDLQDRRSGALLGVYRYMGDHLKVGVGYNFTDFSDDLTELNYENHGFFINLLISM